MLLRTFGLVAVLLAGPIPARAEPIPDPLFSRHIVPLFSKLGCNAGACHGAVKGQNGFRLSLFGADPAADYERLLRDSAGRRLNLVAPESSLLLLKATGQIAHEGGRRMAVGSPEYKLLHAWLNNGYKLDALDKSKVTRLEITPRQQALKMGETCKLKVQASFADGSSEDVTALCTFESRDKLVATVNAAGEAKATGVGDAALVVRFRSEPGMAMLLVPGAPQGTFPEVKPHNFIDTHVLQKLKLLNIHPAPLADDITFLRRVHLDVTGSLPTPDEIRTFLADSSADKRTKKIDALLGRPGYTALWATKFCDILRPGEYPKNTGISEPASHRRFYEWVRARLGENVPYDKMVERILLATSLEGRPEDAWAKELRTLAEEEAAGTPDLKAYSDRSTLDLYWQRGNATGVKGTLQITHAFLGLRMECAQCHRHPHDVWQQDDLLSFANFFMRVSTPGEKASSPAVAKLADTFTNEIKELKEQAKNVGDRAKDKSLAKDEAMKLQAEAKLLGEKAKAFENLGKRIKGTEVHTAVKASFATVVSPLGKQDSKTLRLLGQSEPVTVPADKDARELVMAWLRRPDNPYFAKAIVNRVWAHYFGRGIIDPPDHLSPLNPPTHPKLLAELCDGFIKNRYDLQWLHRTILSSRTYQQSAQTHATSRTDTANYASFYLRRLPAELLVDAINHATASTETYPAELRVPAGTLALEVAGGVEAGKERASLAYAFQIFGRPMRAADVQCDCERDGTPTIVQTLYLANHPRVQEKIANPNGRVAKLVKDITDDEKRIEEIFLWTLSRAPTDTERQACMTYVRESAAPQRAYEDVMWSLLNTKEFLLNH